MNLVEDLKNGVVTLGQLKSEYGIIIKDYEDRIVLNYNQIESPKSHPYVVQSRGIILRKGTFEILCLPFDRFFNFGEVIDHSEIIDFNKAECHQKVDGSLIKIYWDGMKWCIATRGTAFAESTVNGWDLTFKDLVLKALDCANDEEFQLRCMFNLTFQTTYLFEITAMENRVVTVYQGYTLWWLATRHHKGGYLSTPHSVERLGAKFPERFTFGSIEECLNTAKSLPDLQEGYVVYQDGQPVCKIKSPAYVAIHHIRSEGLNPKRIIDILLTGELDEYLTYFPEDKNHFKPYQEAIDKILRDVNEVWYSVKHITDQKEFALLVKDYKWSGMLFGAKRDLANGLEVDLNKSFFNQANSYLQTLIKSEVIIG